MKAFLCAVALLSLCSAARAERIQIVAAIANYITAEDVVDFEVWLDQPFDDAIHRLSILGGDYAAVTSSDDGVEFQIGNHTFTGNTTEPINEFNLRTFDQVNGGGINEVHTLDLDYVAGFGVREDVLRYIVGMTVPADLLRFDDYTPDENNEARFFYAAIILDGLGGAADVFMSYSSIDEPGYEEILTPEPSAFALLGVAALHLIGLPRLRQRFRKRHVAGEAQ